MSGTEALPGAGVDILANATTEAIEADPDRKAWKAGESGLTGLSEANVAPLAPDAARSRVKRWLWCIGLVSAFLVGVALYAKYQAHKAAVAVIQAKPVVLPPLVAKPVKAKPKPKATQSATTNIATEAINTPAMLSFEAKKEIEIVTQKQDQPAPIGIAPPFPPFPPN
jgi:hypothetical protein